MIGCHGLVSKQAHFIVFYACIYWWIWDVLLGYSIYGVESTKNNLIRIIGNWLIDFLYGFDNNLFQILLSFWRQWIITNQNSTILGRKQYSKCATFSASWQVYYSEDHNAFSSNSYNLSSFHVFDSIGVHLITPLKKHYWFCTLSRLYRDIRGLYIRVFVILKIQKNKFCAHYTSSSIFI